MVSWLALLPKLAQVCNVYHVSMLRKHELDPAHMLDFEEIEVNDMMLYIEEPVWIVYQKEQVLRSKAIPFIKVLWRYHETEEAT